MKLYKEIKDRKIRKYLAIYLSACITTIGLVHLFSFRYQLPTFIFDSLLIILFFGIISVIIIAWFHGKEGPQKIKTIEYVFHSIIFISAVGISYLLANRGPIKILELNSKTVAVLPFTNLSDSKEDEYFIDGITEDILTQLSKISELRVISRTSVMKYKNTNLTIPEIGRELNAGAILEGSIRRAGEKVRITGQLINANNDEHIWAESFDRNIDDIFAVQSEIAKRIANELEAKLAPKEEILLTTKPTNNIEAYAYCLKGRKFALRYTDDDNEKAIEFYKKALEIDPNYALAYASLASAYDQKVRRYFYPEEWRDSAIAMSNKALAINPNLAEGHSSLAKSYEAKQNYKMAKYHYEKAIRLNPSYYAAIYNLGVVYYNEGKLDRAYPLIKKSILLEPDNVFGYTVLGGIYQKLNCDKLALSNFEKVLELEPQNLLGHIYIIDQFILMKDFARADKYFNSLTELSPEWFYTFSTGAKLEMLKENYKSSKKYFDKILSSSGEEGYDYAFVLAKLKQGAAADSILNSELNSYNELIKNSPENSNFVEKNLSDIYALKGNYEQSLRLLNRAVNKGWFEYRINLVYPYLDSLKQNDEFNRIVERMKIKTDSLKFLASKDDPSWINCN
jgi:TolB-like protein/Tfp pilus assembly protein PilF